MIDEDARGVYPGLRSVLVVRHGALVGIALGERALVGDLVVPAVSG